MFGPGFSVQSALIPWAAIVHPQMVNVPILTMTQGEFLQIKKEEMIKIV